MVFETKALVATEVPFGSSVTNCSTSAASWLDLKLNGTWRDSETLRVTLLDLDFIFMFRVIDLRSGDKDGDSDGNLFQSDGKSVSAG